MRTYTRKRPECQEIEGVLELCRLCLCKAEETVPIFNEDSENVCAKVSMRIMICVGLEMTHEEYLPNKICVACYNELERCYIFRKKCEATYQKLKSHILAVKEREFAKAMAVKIDNQDLAVKQEAVVESHPHLLLTVKENQQVELIDIAHLDSIQLDSLQEFNIEKVNEINNAEKQNIEVQDVTNPTLEIQTTASDLSLIMSAMLVELGVLRQEEGGLVLVDKDLRTVELEGYDNTKVVLRLMEEDEEFQNQDDSSTNFITLPNLQIQENEILPAPEDPLDTSYKQKKKARDVGTVCGSCGKRFASRSVLARHARVHSGERPHACRVCDRRFAQRAVMMRHELVHKESRPFKCTSCSKSFTQRGALVAHARTHQPRALALHACPDCDKVFLYPSGLSRHMSVHTGRVWSCGACGRGFSDSSSLRRHEHNAHRAAAHRATAHHTAHRATDTTALAAPVPIAPKPA